MPYRDRVNLAPPSRRALLFASLAALAILGCGAGSAGQGGGGSSSTSAAGGQGPGGGGTSSSSSSGNSSSSGTGDPLDAARQACVDKINALRATKGLPAYTRWAAAESCVDQEVTHDETVGVAHDQFNHGSCDGSSGQGECMGTALTPDGIRQCLDLMWSEKDQQGCGGCDSCPWAQNCADCTFLSCGHYMAMSSKVFTQAACGFSSAPNASWSGIDYR